MYLAFCLVDSRGAQQASERALQLHEPVFLEFTLKTNGGDRRREFSDQSLTQRNRTTRNRGIKRMLSVPQATPLPLAKRRVPICGPLRQRVESFWGVAVLEARTGVAAP